jgi:hypothetical protein
MAWRKPKYVSRASSTASSTAARSEARLIRSESHWSPRSSERWPSRARASSGRGEASPQRKPSTFSTRSTANTSAALSLKMPLMPVWEAIAWMRRAMASKSGPAVSERRKRRRRRKASNVTGSQTSTAARGLASRLRVVLLKNWRLRATWRSST